MDTSTQNSGNYQKNLRNGNAFSKHEERKQKLKQLAEKVQYEALLRFASNLGISAEDLLRILADIQGITPELGRRIDYLWVIEFGKVLVEVPRSILDLVIIPPKPLEVEGRKCSLFIHIDGLEHGFSIYHALNYKDYLPTHIRYHLYDGALDSPRNYLNEFFVNFMRVKDKSMTLVESELSLEVRYGEECPKSRVFEMELIEIETETLRYGLKYANGGVLKSVGNLPIKEIVRILKSVGAWE